ncbi:hypothetical protein FCIRC_1728 [Fusarium circinatum]|uniref:Uncharacterized protein n=1 Tax=Fusarium circinatum TaxID=48490 RepID=A0A8H5UML1_FUSCI|nr:hypothetical protein FCIRC_1728 [Fusarium circinatum]
MSNANQGHADWSKVHLRDDYTWTEGTSKNGRPFKIGTSKDTTTSSAHRGPANNLLSLSSKTPFDINVNWKREPPADFFKHPKYPTPQETTITSITSYRLNTGKWFYNELEFTCTEPYHFYFYDKTGDYYGNDVFWPRDGTFHIIVFWSSDPTIVRVTGS